MIDRLGVEPGIAAAHVMVVAHGPPTECFCLGGDVPTG